MGDKVSMKVSLIESKGTRENIAHLSSSVCASLTSKEKLLTFILNDVFDECREINDYCINLCKIERKSKRHKKFVPLEYADDFKELQRSLRVKKHLKLVVYLNDYHMLPSESPLYDAIDQIKRISSELQKSEFWDLLKSLTTKIDCDVSASTLAVTKSERINSKSKIFHENILCDSCHPHDNAEQISGTRYKCMDCKNFDLCEGCYLSKVSVFNHLPTHIMLAIPYPVSDDNFRFLCSPEITNYNCSDLALMSMLGSESEAGDVRIADMKNARKGNNQSVCLEKLMSSIPGEENDKLDVICNLIETKHHKGCAEEAELLLGILLKNGETHLYVDNRSSLVLPQGSVTITYQKEDLFLHLLELQAESNIPPNKVAIFKVEISNADTLNEVKTLSINFNGKAALKGKFTFINLDEITGKSMYMTSVVTSEERGVNKFLNDSDLGIMVIPKGKFMSQVLITNKASGPFKSERLIIKIVNRFESTVALVKVERSHCIASGRSAKFNVPINNNHFKEPFRVVVETEKSRFSCGLNLENSSGILKAETEQMKSKGQEFSQQDSSERMGVLLKAPSAFKNLSIDVIDSSTEEACPIELDTADISKGLTADGCDMEHSSIVLAGHSDEYASSINTSTTDSGVSLHKETQLNPLVFTLTPSKQLKSSFCSCEEEDIGDYVSERDEYDVISIADTADIPADYEVLSRTNSYEF